MREILFRGKDFSGVINHSWCFGSLDTTGDDRAIIIYLDRFGNRCRIIVDPKTVGQYTGLKDKNGTKIFDGDIVLVPYIDPIFKCKCDNTLSERAIVRYGDSMFYVEYIESGDKFTLSTMEGYMEIVGNIYDNPELLGGNNNG